MLLINIACVDIDTCGDACKVSIIILIIVSIEDVNQLQILIIIF